MSLSDERKPQEMERENHLEDLRYLERYQSHKKKKTGRMPQLSNQMLDLLKGYLDNIAAAIVGAH